MAGRVDLVVYLLVYINNPTFLAPVFLSSFLFTAFCTLTLQTATSLRAIKNTINYFQQRLLTTFFTLRLLLNFLNHRHPSTFGDFTMSFVFVKDLVVNVGWAFSKYFCSSTVNVVDHGVLP